MEAELAAEAIAEEQQQKELAAEEAAALARIAAAEAEPLRAHTPLEVDVSGPDDEDDLAHVEAPPVPHDVPPPMPPPVPPVPMSVSPVREVADTEEPFVPEEEEAMAASPSPRRRRRSNAAPPPADTFLGASLGAAPEEEVQVAEESAAVDEYDADDFDEEDIEELA